MVCGCHLEGPYISSEDGAARSTPAATCAGGRLGRIRALQAGLRRPHPIGHPAPEPENAVPFIRQAVASGVVISLGHTAATPEQILAATDAGATLSTHLGNGAPGDDASPSELILRATGRRPAERQPDCRRAPFASESRAYCSSKRTRLEKSSSPATRRGGLDVRPGSMRISWGAARFCLQENS